ncbi:McrC family protein [Paraburkholderia sp. BL21I4N1]|uniref:McrC family protein n=1 Tax=Paraburkholderia sp. BL21I4N1 TaxID=1938801 RepID=UPI000CFAC4BA|nr:McrC family protein [Paraburkholderia sp. BL21I4N1]PQV44931.1 5-methylcytosine-specific restriction enzyme subunit McrC [Paraburkholderia sp. BL21I4N1]
MSYRTLTVREFARLTTSAVPTTLDQAQVTDADFEWLCEISARMRTQSGAHILHIDGRRWLRLDNYVGVLESPGGLRVEILPKHVERIDSQTVRCARVLLRRMLEASMNLTPREGGEAALDQFDHPLTEWVMRQFLLALEYVVKRGMRSDYLRVEEEQRYLRGQLDMAKQARASPARADIFNIRHDVFSIDRAENRLLKSALQRVSKSSRDADNWRLANELLHILKEVPTSQNVQADFRSWSTDRLITHYLRVRPWCQIVLGDQMPLALAGEAQGISLLFPMEKLFERYVGRALRVSLPVGYRLTEQASRHWLCDHENAGIFRLEPDFLIEGPDFATVVDAKWKLLDGADRTNNYGLRQADFYQLYAYGQKYIGESGELTLIYPRTGRFETALEPFYFAPGLRLHVLPFDLNAENLHGPNHLAPGVGLPSSF